MKTIRLEFITFVVSFLNFFNIPGIHLFPYCLWDGNHLSNSQSFSTVSCLSPHTCSLYSYVPTYFISSSLFNFSQSLLLCSLGILVCSPSDFSYASCVSDFFCICCPVSILGFFNLVLYTYCFPLNITLMSTSALSSSSVSSSSSIAAAGLIQDSRVPLPQAVCCNYFYFFSLPFFFWHYSPIGKWAKPVFSCGL